MLLGAGRRTVDAAIDPAAGIVIVRGLGERVAAGDVIAELHSNPMHEAGLPAALELLREACEIGPAAPPARPIVIDRLA